MTHLSIVAGAEDAATLRKWLDAGRAMGVTVLSYAPLHSTADAERERRQHRGRRHWTPNTNSRRTPAGERQ